MNEKQNRLHCCYVYLGKLYDQYNTKGCGSVESAYENSACDTDQHVLLSKS